MIAERNWGDGRKHHTGCHTVRDLQQKVVFPAGRGGDGTNSVPSAQTDRGAGSKESQVHFRLPWESPGSTTNHLGYSGKSQALGFPSHM